MIGDKQNVIFLLFCAFCMFMCLFISAMYVCVCRVLACMCVGMLACMCVYMCGRWVSLAM